MKKYSLNINVGVCLIVSSYNTVSKSKLHQFCVHWKNVQCVLVQVSNFELRFEHFSSPVETDFFSEYVVLKFS